MSMLVFQFKDGTGGPEDPWIMEIYHALADETGVGVAVDATGNPYICGNTESVGAGDKDGYLAKVNKGGTVNWQRTIGSANADTAHAVKLDSSGNVYVMGNTYVDDAGLTFTDSDVYVAKYDNDGNIQWQRKIGSDESDPGTNIQTANGLGVDGSGNVYVGGTTTDGPGSDNDMFVFKYNTSGVLQWQRTLSGDQEDTVRSLDVDSSGNVYITGRTTSSPLADTYTLIVKYDTSGNIQWQRTLGVATGIDRGESIVTDSAGNSYIGVDTSQGDVAIAKYNSAGVLQWQRQYSDANTIYGLALDNSDGLYAISRDDSDADRGVLFKVNTTAGTLQWARFLADTNSGDRVRFGEVVVSSGTQTIFIIGWWDRSGGADRQFLLSALRMDGSDTGSYGPHFTYGDFTNMTESASTLNDAAGPLSDASSSYSEEAAGLTSSPQGLLWTTYLKV